MSDAIIQTVPLGMPWTTFDPFLFCVHHNDAYPRGNEFLGPEASLEARDLGMDFSGSEGWSMYHGSTVPGFPQHPHRGFETVTFMRQGFIDHSDSLGATARFGRGDAQWLTAGEGIVHCEMFPLLDQERPNPCELFQIWLNLPASHKMVDPYFTMMWREEIPRMCDIDAEGRRAELTVIAGAVDGVIPQNAPPDSWAAQPEADVAIWQLALDPGATWTLPPASATDTVRTMYVFNGSASIGERVLRAPLGASLRTGEPVAVTGGADGSEILVLQGRPIGEPVVQYGPFVMNDEAGIQAAFSDYRRTGFGGWPWPTDDPVHPRETARFARHPNGRFEDPEL
jgi:quercetin 2,3-dioxygenase